MKVAMILFSVAVAVSWTACGGESATALSEEFSLGVTRAGMFETSGEVELRFDPAWVSGAGDAKASVVAITHPGLESAVETVLAAGSAGESGSVNFTPTESCRLVHRVTDSSGRVLGELAVRCLSQVASGTSGEATVDSRAGLLQKHVNGIMVSPVVCDPKWGDAAFATLEKLRYAKEGGEPADVETLASRLTGAETLPLSLAYDVRGSYALRLTFRNAAGDEIGVPMEAKYAVNRTIGTMIIFR